MACLRIHNVGIKIQTSLAESSLASSQRLTTEDDVWCRRETSASAREHTYRHICSTSRMLRMQNNFKRFARFAM